MFFNWILIVLFPIIAKLKKILKKKMEQRVQKGVYRRNLSKSLLNLEEIRPKELDYTDQKNQRSVQIKNVESLKRNTITPSSQRNNTRITKSIQKFDSTLFLDSEKEDSCQAKNTKGSEKTSPSQPSKLFPKINAPKQKQQFKIKQINEEEKTSNHQQVLENTLLLESAEKTLNSEVEDGNDNKVKGLTKEVQVKVDFESLLQQIESKCDKPEKKSRVSFFFPEIDVIAYNEKKSFKRKSSLRINEDEYYKEKKSLGFPYYTESYSNVNMGNQFPYRNSKVILTNQQERSIPLVQSPNGNKVNGGFPTWLSSFSNAGVVVDVEENLKYIQNKRRISRIRKGI